MLTRIVRTLLFKVVSALTALAIRANYRIVRRRIRRRKVGDKIRVLFMVNEISKWKTQSLYDLMKESGRYEPVIGVTVMDVDRHFSDVDQQIKMNRTAKFFEDRGMRVIRLYDAQEKTVTAIKQFGADVVFYQQPYVMLQEHLPDVVSYDALTCYVPYYVTNYGTRHFDYEFRFHKQVWRYFILNEDFARAYRRLGWLEGYAGKILGLGHTGLDYYYLHKDERCDEGIVIYAPHCSIDYPGNENLENYSTFLWNGEAILEYAKNHPEFKWVFRPHPSLKVALRRCGAWDDKKIESYWEKWAKIAIVSRDDDYQALFLKSKALITDCGSFLIEYFVTGKPLIHLISSTVKVQPISVAKHYFDTWYKVHDLKEMAKTFETVLERGEDPMRKERLTALHRAKLADNYAAQNLLEYLDTCLIIR